MIRRHFLLTSVAAPLALAQAEPQPTSLFNGSSLQGWHVTDGPQASFYVDDGAIVVSESGNSPTWLRSELQYENFDFRCEYFVKGWIDSGIYLHAPRHGNAQDSGFCIKLFHKQDIPPKAESAGSIFPLVPPLGVNVKGNGQWNELRIRLNWPRLQVWSNGEIVQDANVEAIPELANRLRHGYLGLQSLSYPIRFRNLTIQELPSKLQWVSLYQKPADLAANWQVEEGKAKWSPLGPVLRADGLGHLATKEKFQNFALQLYIRSSKYANGGVLFRAEGSGSKAHYEIQIHDVEGAVYPTGSLYGIRRAKYPHTTPEEWYLFQLIVEGKRCIVRVNGETVTDYPNLDRSEPGHILLQAHQAGKWMEYKDIHLRRL